MNSAAPGESAARLALAAAASAALPLSEIDMQAFGGRSKWNSQTRPGRIEARTKGIRVIVRSGELALAADPSLDLETVAGAVRSFALRLQDLHICPLSGRWTTSPAAVKNRGEELARAIREIALTIKAATP